MAQDPQVVAVRSESKFKTYKELIAAAHSSCYSMQLSGLLTAAGNPPQRLDTSAEVTLGQRGEGFAITGIALTVRADVPGVDASAFHRARAAIRPVRLAADPPDTAVPWAVSG